MKFDPEAFTTQVEVLIKLVEVVVRKPALRYATPVAVPMVAEAVRSSVEEATPRKVSVPEAKEKEELAARVLPPVVWMTGT